MCISMATSLLLVVEERPVLLNSNNLPSLSQGHWLLKLLLLLLRLGAKLRPPVKESGLYCTDPLAGDVLR